MNLKERKVMITGASSGIGRACAYKFAECGADVLLVARSEQRLCTLADELSRQYGVAALPITLDVSDAQAVQTALSELPEQWQQVDILVNNAGLVIGLDKIQDSEITDWETMIDTNVKGVLYITRCVIKGMLARQQGHIINIGSISGYAVYPGGAVYCATKYALRAISEGLKMDVHGTPLRVSSVDPGMVESNFSVTRFHGDQAAADAVYKGMTPLTGEDIADAVVFCATRPAHVDVRSMVIMPTDQTTFHMVRRDHD